MEMDKREYIEYIGRKHLYMKKFHYDKNTYDEAMIDMLRLLLSNYLIDKDLWREYRDIFNSIGAEYNNNTAEYDWEYMSRYLNDKELDSLERSLKELKRADIQFVIKKWIPSYLKKKYKK